MTITLQIENGRTRMTIRGNPAWMPGKYRIRHEAVAHKCKITKAERKVFGRREKPKPSEWAEKNRVVSVGPFAGTKWKNETTPYLRDLMDAVYRPFVREVYLCCAPQTGKSSLLDNIAGYGIDCEPGPTMYVYPDQTTAEEKCRDRILKMIEKSPALRGYLIGRADDESAIRINLQHMPIYMAWSTSATKTSDKTVKLLIGDETDKYSETPNKKEGGIIGFLRARTIWYLYSYKFILSSTPTVETGHIWVLMTKEAQVIFDFHVVCPDCGGSQCMIFDQIKFPDGERDYQKIENEYLAWYECVHCKSKWTDLKRNFAARMGKWKSRATQTRPEMEMFEYLDTYKPRKIGVHLPSWNSWLVSLSTVAGAFLRSLNDKNDLKNFMNKHKAEPWKTYTKEHKEDRIRALRDDRPMGVVPGNEVVSCLLASVDTQDNGFWYEIRAWGWGPIMDNWQVRFGFVDSFGTLERILYEDEYRDVDGNKYSVVYTVQDAMGHRTAEVYDFARKHLGRHEAFQGRERQTQPYRFANIEYYPGTQKPIPGGVKLLQGNSNYYKNILSSKLEVLPTDPGAWHLCAECHDEWIKQMCAEHIDDETGLWVCPENVKNHAWDVSYMQLVAADRVGVKFWKKESVAQSRQDAKKEEKMGAGKRW